MGANEITVTLPGLKELEVYLDKLGDADDIITTANQLAAEPLRVEIESTSPRGETGGLADSVKIETGDNEVTVTAGDENVVKYAYNYHAINLGNSGGYFTVKQRSRNGNYYNRTFEIEDNPFVFKAAEAKEQEIIDSYLAALDEVARNG